MGDRWHYHPEVELTYFADGKGLRFAGDSIHPFEAPDIVLLGPFLPHYWTCESSRGIAVQCKLSADAPLAHLPEFKAITILWERCKGGVHLRGDLAISTAEQLVSMPGANGLARLATFLNILGTIAAAAPDQFSILSKPFHFRSGTGAYADTIAEAIKFITTRFQDPIRLPEVLAHISMSRASFSRHFRQCTGHSFTTFLQRIRLEHCRRLLATGEYTITESAFKAGFQNLSHFNRLFRQRWNITPRDFRRQVREKPAP